MASRRHAESQRLMEIPLCDPRILTPTKSRSNFRSHSTICLTSPGESSHDDTLSPGTEVKLECSRSKRRQQEDSVFAISGVDESRKIGAKVSKRTDVELGSPYEPLCPPTECDVLEKMVEKASGDSDLSKKARWVIIITAMVLVLMSILLVGITLRLAPVIDELVRKENEEILRVLVTQSPNHRPEVLNQTLPSTTATTTGQPG